MLWAVVNSAPDISLELSCGTVPLELPVKLPVILNVQLVGAEEVADSFLFGSIIHLKSLVNGMEEEVMTKFFGQEGFNSSLFIAESYSFLTINIYSEALPTRVLFEPLTAREKGDLSTVTSRIVAFCNSDSKFSGLYFKNDRQDCFWPIEP